MFVSKYYTNIGCLWTTQHIFKITFGGIPLRGNKEQQPLSPCLFCITTILTKRKYKPFKRLHGFIIIIIIIQTL